MIFEGWSAALLSIVIAAALWELICSERDARELMYLATLRTAQYTELQAYCERKKNTTTHSGLLFRCSTSLLWISEGRWKGVCEEGFRAAHTYPLRWFMVRSECYLSWPQRRSEMFSVIHWLEKS